MAQLAAALQRLLPLYREQIIGLHEKFSLPRPLRNDLAALAVVSQ